MIKICPSCSRIDEKMLATKLSNEEIELGCIDHCGESAGKSFGLVNGILVVAEDEEAFVLEVLTRK